MNLHFLEIGTSNFDSLIQKATENTVGISVEPSLYYLNQLPDTSNVIKVNSAISFDNSEGDIDFYYVPEQVIKEKNLPNDLCGCNCINNYHPNHLKYNLQEHVIITKVKQIPIAKLLKKYNVKKINYLKIDTEGGDTFILEHLYNYLIEKKDHLYYPKKILFESNQLTSKERINFIIDIYKNLGYKQITRKKTDNTELIYEQN